MQTLILDHKPSSKAMRHVLADPSAIPPPIVKPLTAPASTSAAPDLSVQASVHAELDAMLIRDPNVGAIQGLRVALLFNAGLALSGLVGWEIWSLLAH